MDLQTEKNIKIAKKFRYYILLLLKMIFDGFLKRGSSLFTREVENKLFLLTNIYSSYVISVYDTGDKQICHQYRS
jgi:hypothetical protein